MCATSAKAEETVVICGVSWEAYEKILAALGEHHLRHSYDRGTLEMWSVIHDVSWNEYQAFLEALGDIPLRHSYDRGTLEMMTPRRDHDWTKSLIGRFIESMAYELELPLQSVGSTTQQNKAAERGVQPDESFYVASEPIVRGRKRLDPDVDPPPDLIVEVDVTNSCVSRLDLFATLRIPELWRYCDEQLVFYALNRDRKYDVIERSQAFPWLTPDDVLQFLSQMESSEDTRLARAFATHAKAKFEAYSRDQQPQKDSQA